MGAYVFHHLGWNFPCLNGLGGIPYDFLHLAIWRSEAQVGNVVEQAGEPLQRLELATSGM